MGLNKVASYRHEGVFDWQQVVGAGLLLLSGVSAQIDPNAVPPNTTTTDSLLTLAAVDATTATLPEEDASNQNLGWFGFLAVPFLAVAIIVLYCLKCRPSNKKSEGGNSSGAAPEGPGKGFLAESKAEPVQLIMVDPDIRKRLIAIYKELGLNVDEGDKRSNSELAGGLLESLKDMQCLDRDFLMSLATKLGVPEKDFGQTKQTLKDALEKRLMQDEGRSVPDVSAQRKLTRLDKENFEMTTFKLSPVKIIENLIEYFTKKLLSNKGVSLSDQNSIIQSEMHKSKIEFDQKFDTLPKLDKLQDSVKLKRELFYENIEAVCILFPRICECIHPSSKETKGDRTSENTKETLIKDIEKMIIYPQTRTSLYKILNPFVEEVL